MGAKFGLCCNQSSNTMVTSQEDMTVSTSAEEEGQSLWLQLGGGELEEALGNGLVKCLDSRYLVERAHRGEAVVRRQDMPEEAFVDLDRLKALGVYSTQISEGAARDVPVTYQWLPLMIVSYAWLSPQHPDPFAETLGVLAKALEACEPHGVIIDFTALPQVPRTEAEEKVFRLGLPCLNRFYSHPHVLVLKVSEFPKGYPHPGSRPRAPAQDYKLPEGYVPEGYSGRGWCFAEAAMAGLGKSPNFVCDVSRLQGGRHVVGESVVLPQPPLIPGKFDLELKSKRFTQPKADVARVQGLYRSAFDERVGTAKSLMYSRLGWGRAEIVTFAEALAFNRTAETLQLSDNELEEEGMKALAAVLGSHAALQRLVCSHCQLGDAALRALAEALRTNSSLAALVLGENQIGDEGARSLAEALCANSSNRLTTLNLRLNRIKAEGGRWLAEVLRNSSTLTDLNLESNKVGAEGARWLGEALRSNVGLRELRLHCNEVGDAGARCLADGLRWNSSLKTLCLLGNEIGDEGARSLAEALRSHSSLAELKLERNEIGDEGARRLAEALRSNVSLREVDLERNRIKDEGARWLAEALLHGQRSLKRLQLSDNQIGEEGARRLAEAAATAGCGVLVV